MVILLDNIIECEVISNDGITSHIISGGEKMIVVNTRLTVKCFEKNCCNNATKDYNGQGYMVCENHFESLNNYFDEEYD